MIVFDLPEAVTNIKPEQAEKWGRPYEELFKLGLQNIRNNYRVNITNEKFLDFHIWFVQSNHFYSPNIVFELHERQGLIGSKALVATYHIDMLQ